MSTPILLKGTPIRCVSKCIHQPTKDIIGNSITTKNDAFIKEFEIKLVSMHDSKPFKKVS